MITECPLSLECNLVCTYELPTNHLYIGEIVAAYTANEYLTHGKLDVQKINPLLLTMPDNNYWTIGKHEGKAWDIGRKLIKGNQ
jgi:flavin reductase (DIM6/NTAB) family NADH-FMN oxidoreductase RutF